jgi:hypothetical protein
VIREKRRSFVIVTVGSHAVPVKCLFFTERRVRRVMPAYTGPVSKSEKYMRSTELFRSCANEHVAAAALACIGGALKKRVATAARRADLTTGAFVARLVADFDRKASPRRRKSLEQGMFREQTPILAGLRHVVEAALAGEWDVAAPKAELGGQPHDKVLGKGEIHWSRGRAKALGETPELKSCCC